MRRNSDRLRALRDDLHVVNEQLAQLADEAADWGIRALVSDSPGADVEHRHAQAHAESMAAHRQHVLASIAELEQRQDHLLDEMSRS